MLATGLLRRSLRRNGLAFKAVAVATALAVAACCTPGTASSTQGHASIQHVVIVVKENHSFDNYFGSLNAPPSSLAHCESATVQDKCQYDSGDIPAYYRYAREFGYADNYFTDVRGPSWPNDMMMIAAQSPLTADPPQPLSTWACPVTCYDLPTIGERLAQRGVGWRNYGDDPYNPFRSIQRYANDRVHNVDVPQLFSDLNSGNLPAVAWVRPAGIDSEHPGFNIHRGEQWTVSIVNAIMNSRFWSSTAILVTWDDAGTVADHVRPPIVAGSPSGNAIRYGERVALLVISPFTPRGMVSHEILSHASLLKFVEDLFRLQPLTFRDRGANSLDGFFDLSMAPRAPLIL